MTKDTRYAIISINDALEATLLGQKSAKQLQPLLITHERLIIAAAICQTKNTGERARLDSNDKTVLSSVTSGLSERFGAYPGVDYEKVVKDTILGVSDLYDVSEALLLDLAVESICDQSGSDALPHTEVISASEGEAGAAKTVKLVTQHLREYMLSLYQQRKTLELRVLGRLLQISTCVLLNIPAEVTELVQKFVDKIVKEQAWVEHLVGMATQYHSNALKVSDSDVVPAGWEECALLAATCLLFIATRESYSAQQAVKDLDSGEDGDGSMSIQTVRSDAHFHYVLAQENSRELTALVKLMQAVDPNDIVSMATDESSSSFPGANQISLFVPSSQNGAMNRVNGRVTMATPKPVVEYYSDFSIVIMHAVYYGVYAYTSVHCNTEVKLITNLLDGPWKSRTLQSVYSLFLATTMERGLVDGDTVQHDEYLAKALQHTVPATDRAHDTLSVHPTTLQLMGEHQLIGGDGSDGDVGRENVLRILRTRVVTSLFIEGSENRELFLRCYEEIMGCVYLMKKDEWLRKSQSITEMIVLREFVDLWGALYKDWPEGTLVLLRTECLERLLAYGFDVPEEAQDFKLKAQHCLAVYASFIGMLGSLCNSSECSAQLTAAIKYREDRLSWKRFKEFIDDYVRDLDPSRRAYANGGRIPAPAASMGTYTQGGNYGNYDTSGNHGNYDPHWNGSQGGYAQNLRPTFGSQRAFEGNGFGQQQHTLQDTHMYERRDSARNMDTANDKDAETDQDMPQIDPTDEKGLRLILRLIRRACRYPDSDAVKHIAYKWEPVGQLFKLLTCRIPLTLRAAVMRTIAAFAITPAHAYELWSVMDEHNLRDVVLVDRQALEAKDGVYPLTIAFLELLHVLLNATDHLKLTNTLGLPRRVPGLAAYLRFVVDVFVLAQDAAFVYESERWKVFKLCSGIFEVVLTQYKISPAHFYDRYYSPDNAYTDDPLLPLTTQQDLQQQQQTRSAFSDPDSSLYPDGSLSADSSLIAPTHVCQSERANRPPGMQLLTEFLTGNKQPLVKGVLRLLERGVSALTRAKNMAKRNAQCKKLHARAEICIRSSLRLIHAVLVSQADFIHFAISAGSKNCLPTLVPLEKHVISADKHPVMGHTNSVKAIAQFVSYDCAEIASLSVRIMTLLSQALVSGPKLVPLVRDTQIKAESYVMGHVSSIDSDRRDFMMGYVQRLVQRAPRVPTLDTAHTRHSDKYTRDNRLTRTGTGSTTRPDAAKDQNLPHTPSHDILEEIVQLLIVNLTDVPFPNVAHYILGYDLNTPETTDLRRERSCLYHIHAMVQMGVHERSGRSHGNGGGGVGRDGDRMYEAYMGTQTLTGTGANGGRGQRMGRGEEGETLFQFNPKLSELCYRLIYLLCTQSKTSVATLNWLRTNGDDFFCSQLRHVRLGASDFINHTHQGLGINRFTMKAVAIPQTPPQNRPLRIADHMDNDDDYPTHIYADTHMHTDTHASTQCYHCGHNIGTQNNKLFRSGVTKFYVTDARADHLALCLVCYCDISHSIDPSHQTVDEEVSLLTQHTWLVRTFTQELLYNIRHHPQSRQVGRLVQYLFQLTGVGEAQGHDVHMLQQGGRVALEMLESLSRIPVEYSEGQSALRRFFLTAMDVGNVFDPAHSMLSDRGAVVVDIESVLSEAIQAQGQTNVPLEQLDAWNAYLRLLIVQNCKVDLATVRDRAVDAWQEMLGVALQGLALDQTGNAFVTLFDLLSGLLVKMDDYTLAEACGRSAVAVSDKLRSIKLQGLAQAAAEAKRHAQHVGQVPVYQILEAMDAIVRVLVDKITSQSTRSCLYTTLLNLISFAKDSGSSRHGTHSSRNRGNEAMVSVTNTLLLPSESLMFRLIPVVATDAMSGNGSCKSMGVALMGRLLKSDPNRWMESLSQHGFLDHFVGILKHADVEVSRALHTHSGSLLPIYSYEAKMSFLVLVASVKEGAAALVASGMLRRLSTFTCLQESPLHTDETDQSFGSRADRERRVVLWALRLIGGILTSVGRENVFAVAEALDCVAVKKELFLSVLRGGAHSSPTARLTPHVLEEIKLTVGIFYRLSADAAEFTRRLGDSALVFHKHLLGCLVRFAVPSRWKSRMAYPVTSTVEPRETSSLDYRMRDVQSPQVVDAAVIAAVECDVRDICLSLVSYLRSVVKVAKQSRDTAQIMPLLSPNLQNAIVLANNDSSAPSHISDELANEENASSKRPPSLSALVIYIRTAIPSLLSRVTASAARGRGRGSGAENGTNLNMGMILGGNAVGINVGATPDTYGHPDANAYGSNQGYTRGNHGNQGYGMPHSMHSTQSYGTTGHNPQINHGYGYGRPHAINGTFGPITGDFNDYRSTFNRRARHQPSLTEDTHAVQILLCGIESALYVLMLHLHYYLTVAATTTPLPYVTTKYCGSASGIDVDDGGMLMGGEITWDQMTRESREKLKSTASSCLAQVLDNLQFSQDIQAQLYTLTGCSSEFIETVSQQIRTLLELERRGVSY